MALLFALVCVAFIITGVSAAPPLPADEAHAFCEISARGTKYVLDASKRGRYAKYGRVINWRSNGGQNQHWIWDGPQRDILRNVYFPNKVLTFDTEDYDATTGIGRAYLSEEDRGLPNQRWRVEGSRVEGYTIFSKDEETAGAGLMALQVNTDASYETLKVGKHRPTDTTIYQTFNIVYAPPAVKFMSCNEAEGLGEFDMCLSISNGLKYAGLTYHADSVLALTGKLFDTAGNVQSDTNVSVNISKDGGSALVVVDDPTAYDNAGQMYQVNIPTM